MEPSIVAGLVLLNSGDHFLVVQNLAKIGVELLATDRAAIAIQTLGKLVVFTFDSFVFTLANTDVQ